jgi:hypothetical protein
MVAPRTIAARLLDNGTLLARTEFDEVTLSYNSIEKTGHVYSEEFDERTLSLNTPSGGSLLLNGTTDRIYIQGSSDFMFGTDPYTIEGWFKTTSTSPQHLWDFSTGDSVGINGSTIYLYNGSNIQNSGSGVIPQNVWFHVALVRYSQSLSKVFVNGREGLLTDTTVSYNSVASRPLAIGGEVLTNANENFSGYITQFRIVKGLAVYTSRFSTPINPLSARQPSTVGTIAITGNETVLLLSVADNANKSADSGNGSPGKTITGGTYDGSTPSTQNHNGKMKQRSTGELQVANEFDEYNTAALQ